LIYVCVVEGAENEGPTCSDSKAWGATQKKRKEKQGWKRQDSNF